MKSSTLYLFGLCLVNFIGVRSEIDFTQNRVTLTPPDSSYIKYVEDRHVVACGGDANDNLRWIKPDGTEVESRGRVKQEKVDKKLWLIFGSITKEDQGEWACVSDFDDEVEGKSFQMNVYVPIKFEITQPTIEANEGDDIAIPCEVYGLPEPSVNWYNNDDKIPENVLNDSGKSKYTKLADGLLIRNVSYSDSGDYTCKALQITNIMTDVKEQTIQLVVQYKPRIVGGSHKEIFGFIDGEVDIICDAHSSPKPNFIWYRFSKRISPKNIKIYDDNSVLKIFLKSKEDFGEYKCRAENDLGMDEQMIKIIEGKKPDMPKVFFIRGFSSDTFDLDVGAKVDKNSKDKMAITGYRFELIPKHIFDKQKSWNGSWIKEFAIADGVTYLLSPLSENTTYKVRVASRNHAGYSDYTETLEFTTLSKQPLISKGSSLPSTLKVIVICLVIQNYLVKF